MHICMVIVVLLDIYSLLQALMRVFFFIKMCKINPFFYFASFDAVALRAFIVKEV